jgi:hypothetical protein
LAARGPEQIAAAVRTAVEELLTGLLPPRRLRAFTAVLRNATHGIIWTVSLSPRNPTRHKLPKSLIEWHCA